MIAFLKRHWFLLSWVVVLLGCSVVDLVCISYSEMPGSPGTYYRQDSGLSQGCFRSFERVVMTAFPTPGWLIETHRPQFDDLSERSATVRNVHTQVPLWLPLSVVFGWIVMSELRWREKRARKADANPAQ